MIYITKPCLNCGKSSKVKLDDAKVARWKRGERIQNVWPEMTPDERELLISGIHPECWKLLPWCWKLLSC